MKITIPYYLHKAGAGFPSPATDYLEHKLDLNEYLVKHPAATFIVKASGPSMTEAGIETNVFRDLFVALGEDLGGDIWSMHLQYKPLLRLIWLGPFIMILGGLVRLFLLKPLSGTVNS